MLAETPLDDAVDLYYKLAPRYDKLHHRWLRHAGGEAQAALEGLVRALATPNSRLLDAGCGTGNLARRLILQARFATLQVSVIPAVKRRPRDAQLG